MTTDPIRRIVKDISKKQPKSRELSAAGLLREMRQYKQDALGLYSGGNRAAVPEFQDAERPEPQRYQQFSRILGGPELSNEQILTMRQQLHTSEGMPKDEWDAIASSIQQDIWPGAIAPMHRPDGDRVRALGELPSFYEKTEQAVIGAANQPLFHVGNVGRRSKRHSSRSNPVVHVGNVGISATDIVGIGLIGYGSYVGVRALTPQLQRAAGRAGGTVYEKTFGKSLDQMIAKRARGIPADQFNRVQNFVYDHVAKNKAAIQEQATNRMLSRMGRTANAASARQAAKVVAEETVQDIEKALIPSLRNMTATGVPQQAGGAALAAQGGVRGSLGLEDTLDEMSQALEQPGRLPQGQGTKSELRLERARLVAENEVVDLSTDALESTIQEIQQELGTRALPYHGGQKQNLFPDQTAAELDQVLKVYERVLQERGAVGPEQAPEGVTPQAVQPEVAPTVEPVVESVTEEAAVAELAGAPPKPPKNWDKISGDLWERFERNMPDPTPTVVPKSRRIRNVRGQIEKAVSDEFARLNKLGWESELSAAMTKAASGRAGELYRQTMTQIDKAIGGDNSLISYVDKYLLLRHQLEVMRATGRTDLVVRGKTTEKYTPRQIGLLIRAMKDQLGPERYAQVKEAAGFVPAIYNHILSTTEELTPEQVKGLIRKYPWYNPALFDQEGAPAIYPGGKLTPATIKRLTEMDQSEMPASPLMSLPISLRRRVVNQAKNKARKAFAEEAAANPETAGGPVEIVDAKPAKGAFFDYYDQGQRRYLTLGKGAEWLAEDIQLLETQPTFILNKIVKVLQRPSKAAFTTYNPGFVIYNTMFDAITTYFQEGIGPKGFATALARNIRAMVDEDPVVNQFRASGGDVGGFFRKEDTSAFIRQKGKQLRLRNPDSLKKYANPFVLIRELGHAGENAGRVATFQKAMREGLSEEEAALRARRVTVDFSRMGTAARFLNDYFIFFNAGLQGFLLPGRAIKRDPRTLLRLGVLISGYIGLTLYNQSHDEYEDVPDSEKVGKLLVMLPSDEYNKYGQKVPHYLVLAPLREFALLTAPVEYMMGKLRTKHPDAYRTLGEEFGVAWPAVSPLSMITQTGGLEVPTQLGGTIQQLVQNHDTFRDRDIVDEEMALLPATEQYDQWTDKVAIKVGQALGISPKRLDFFMSNTFGQMGRDGLRLLEFGIQDNTPVDARIAGLVNQLKEIQTQVPPNQIRLKREEFLSALDVEDRELVLNLERLPADQVPIISNIFNRFYRDWAGQVYRTARDRAKVDREIPEQAVESYFKGLKDAAGSLLKGDITKQDFDDQLSYIRARYTGATGESWRQATLEGAVATSDVEEFLPESYQRPGELQALGAYHEIRGKLIDEAGTLTSEKWEEITAETERQLRQLYSVNEVAYALGHTTDWINDVPEPARSVLRRREQELASDTWWDNYRGAPETKTETRKTEAPTGRSSAGDLLEAIRAWR